MLIVVITIILTSVLLTPLGILLAYAIREYRR